MWHYFTGATYLYLERNKTFLNTLNQISKEFGLGEKEAVGKRMSEIRAFLGDHIRARGTMFHEYTEMHDSIKTLGMIALLAESDPAYIERVRWFFKDAKYELRESIGKARREALDDFSSLTHRLAPRLKTIVATSEALQKVYLGRPVVELEGLSRPDAGDWVA